MSTTVRTDTSIPTAIASRVLREGYGPGAWHGPDLKAALADVDPGLAFWRPAEGRHNIAEIALHHAYYAHTVRTQLSGVPAEPFVLTGEDWFEADDAATLAWPDILAAVDSQQEQLGRLVADIDAGTATSPMRSEERLDLVLGITCHAIYHAGQIQLIKRLRGA